MRHSENPSQKFFDESTTTLVTKTAESSISGRFNIAGRLHYWWSLFVAGALLVIVGIPVLSVSWLVGKPELVYPWALFGGRNWLRLMGMRICVKGAEFLDPKQTYVFIANHRSYLD